MWFAALDGLVIAAVVALLALRPWQRESIAPAATLTVGLVGGLVGAWLAFTLVSGSLATGPLQPAAIVGGGLGAVVALVVLRTWTVNDRLAVAAAEAATARATRGAARRDRRATRVARPVPGAGLAVLVLTVLRGRARR